jgi:hypothetical protein
MKFPLMKETEVVATIETFAGGDAKITLGDGQVVVAYPGMKVSITYTVPKELAEALDK